MFVSQIYEEAAEILATTDKNKVFRKLTQAVQTLMESGHYFHTNQEVDVCTGWDGQTITLPRGIEVPLGVNIDGSPTYFRGRLFQYHVNKGGMYNSVDWAWDDRGFVATVMDIRQPSQLVAISEHSADAGGQIRVIGTDSNNRDLRTQMPDGTTIDGVLVPIHAQSDFPLGSIEPDGVTIQTRDVGVSPFTKFVSSTPHQLDSGESAVLSLGSGTMPSFIYAGQTYYIGVDDANTIQLYQNSLDAKSGTNPVFLQSILNAGTIALTDARPSNLLTAINLQSTPTIAIDSPNEITFSVGGAIATATISSGAVSAVNLITGGTGYLTAPTVTFIGGGGSNASVTAVVSNGIVTGFTGLSGGSGYTSAPSVSFSSANGSLPSPLAANTTYFAQSLDSTNLQVYASITDAQNGTNPVPLTGNSGKFNTDIRKAIAPQTTLSFAVQHYYLNGDQVQAFTSGGTLPTPLIAGQNYFVNVIDTYTISLHESQADALASTATALVNPIVITDNGTGTNSLVKLLPATSVTGTTSQITAAGLNISAPSGAGAQYQAVVVGSVIAAAVTTGGTKYISAPQIKFSDPPPPPTGTDQQTSPAEGYAVMIPDAVGSTTYAVGSIVITSAGLGYTTSPTISIGNPAGYGGGGAVIGTVTIASGAITNIAVTNGGSGYTSAPAVVITGGGGNGALATANISSGVITSIRIDAGGTGYTSAPSVSVLAGTRAVAEATIKTSFVSSFTQISSGSGYTQPPQVKITGGGGTGATATATISTATITLDSVTRSGTTATATISSGHGYTNGQTVKISGAIPNGYNGQFSIVVPTIDKNVTAGNLTGTGTTANCIINNHGYSDGQTITISGASQSYYNGKFTINVINSNTFTYTTTSSILVSPATGTIYASVPNEQVFTYQVSNSLTSPATGTITSFSGGVTKVNIVTEGTGYTSSPTVTISPSTGVFVEFSSTGTLPAPLVSGTAYRAEAPLNGSTGDFSVVGADFSPITITSSSTGNFYVALTRPFSIAFNKNWSGDFSGTSTGQGVYLASDYLLPTGVNNTTLYYLRVINSSTAQLYDTPALANASPATTGIISVTALGVGQGYFAVRFASYAKAYNNLVVPSSIEYLSNGELVKFSSTGSLPYPLDPSTDYKITLSGNNVSITDTSNNPIVFANAGVPTLPVGQMSMNIVRTFTPVASTSLDAVGSLFEIGDQITVRPSAGDVLPTGLSESSMASPQYYYARPVDANSFEVYDTYAHAVNTAATTGRITFYDMGNKVSSTFFVDSILPPTLVKSILHVEKPETLGYVSLYALDYGRSNDMALVGQYHPTETNPKYRRIRIGKKCSWARIIYRMAHPVISSQYDYIPVENERAIIAAVHACDLEDKDFAEQSQRYWAIALGYLRNQNESMEGHAMMPPQIDGLVYGDRTDPVMF